MIGTRRRDGFLYEMGPNSTLDTTPLINALLDGAGHRERTHRRECRGGDALHRSRRKTDRAAGLARRILHDARVHARPPSCGCSASRSLPARRPASTNRSRRSCAAGWASEFLDYAIDPFVAGIYAGDPERISVGGRLSAAAGAGAGARQPDQGPDRGRPRAQEEQGGGEERRGQLLVSRRHADADRRAGEGAAADRARHDRDSASRATATARSPSKACATARRSRCVRVRWCWRLPRTRRPR